MSEAGDALGLELWLDRCEARLAPELAASKSASAAVSRVRRRRRRANAARAAGSAITAGCSST